MFLSFSFNDFFEKAVSKLVSFFEGLNLKNYIKTLLETMMVDLVGDRPNIKETLARLNQFMLVVSGLEEEAE